MNAGDILNFDYTGAPVSQVLPPGRFKLEVWGAQGGYRSSSRYGGLGGFSTGELTLNEETTVIVRVGGSGNTGGTAGGFNGGGKRSTYNGGGGATDVRVGIDDLLARVMVAGGGGSDGASNKIGLHGGGTTGAVMPVRLGKAAKVNTQTTAMPVPEAADGMAAAVLTRTAPAMTTAEAVVAPASSGPALTHRAAIFSEASTTSSMQAQ